MDIAPFQTEQFFARFEFNTPFQLCNSDCETVSVEELLRLAGRPLEALGRQRLGYGESRGGPDLRRAIASCYRSVDPDEVVVDFANSRVTDHSAVEAIDSLADRYLKAGKSLHIRHLSRDCHRLLTKAGHLMVDSDDDPDYALAVNYQVRTGILGGH